MNINDIKANCLLFSMGMIGAIIYMIMRIGLKEYFSLKNFSGWLPPVLLGVAGFSYGITGFQAEDKYDPWILAQSILIGILAYAVLYLVVDIRKQKRRDREAEKHFDQAKKNLDEMDELLKKFKNEKKTDSDPGMD